MGFFEARPRSATVIAREACTLLEVSGSDFRKTLEIHPEIEVKLLLTVSKRLRNANEELLSLHLHGIYRSSSYSTRSSTSSTGSSIPRSERHRRSSTKPSSGPTR